MPNIQVKLRRGTATEHNTFTGAEGEVTVDTTNNTLRVHDGSTVGGTSLATATNTGVTPGSYTNTDLTVDAQGRITAASNGTASGTPTGTVSAFAGSSAPTGYLLCDGTAVNRTTYAALFGVISTTYGVGDGSTTFNLPDLRGRVVAGLDNMGGSSANRLTDPASTVNSINGDILGNTGGHETHLNTATQSGLPSHSHTIAMQQTNANFDSGSFNGLRTGSGKTTDITGGTNASQAHNNVQPTIILNYIIKF